MTKKHVHELRAESFTLTRWQPIETCPKDGKRFVARGADGLEYEVHWQGGGFVVHGVRGFGVGQLLEWRAL